MDTSLIRPTTMNIRAFDGILRKVQGEIELAIGVRPMFFTVNFKFDVHEIYTIKYSHIYIFSLTFMLFCV